MSVRTRLHGRTPPPARLANRLDQVLGDRLDLGDDCISGQCLDAAEHLLRDLVRHADAGREAALDLLVVDALVTCAFEAAADDQRSLESLAWSAMHRLADTARE